jgi:hypothetical protein
MHAGAPSCRLQRGCWLWLLPPAAPRRCGGSGRSAAWRTAAARNSRACGPQAIIAQQLEDLRDEVLLASLVCHGHLDGLLEQLDDVRAVCRGDEVKREVVLCRERKCLCCDLLVDVDFVGNADARDGLTVIAELLVPAESGGWWWCYRQRTHERKKT